MTTTPSNAGPATQTLSPAQYLYSELEGELASTRKVLERFPEGKGDWRPHEKSRTIGALATHVAELSALGVMVLQTNGMNAGERKPRPPLDSAAELLALFDERTAALREALAAADYESLEQDWPIRMGDRVLLSAPRRTMMRTLLINHLIHHRAQLGVYYRLLGVAVPGTYGPTADEPF